MSKAKFRKVYSKTGNGRFVVSEGYTCGGGYSDEYLAFYALARYYNLLCHPFETVVVRGKALKDKINTPWSGRFYAGKLTAEHEKERKELRESWQLNKEDS